MKREFENTNDISIKREINIKVEKLLDNIDKLDGKFEVYNFSSRSSNYDKCYEWTKNLRTWDVILFKYKNNDILQQIFWWYKHAAVMYDSQTIFDTWSFSSKKSWKNNIQIAINSCNHWMYERIVVLKMWFKFFQETDFKNYIDIYLMDKPYSVSPTSNKYTRFEFYCSLLVWNAHLNSGRYVDMDYDWGLYVRPIDLLYSNKSFSNDYNYF